MYSVSLTQIVNEYNLTLCNSRVDISEKLVKHSEVNRPALQLAGFFSHFDSDRMQIVGIVEYTYMQNMSEEERHQIFKKLFSYQLPCFVICRGLEPFPEMLAYATENDIPVFSYQGSTTEFMGEIIRWLKVQLAPRITMHGVLVDIYGEGVLIMGESGIGKSESALELIKRGHRLVADDAVEIKRASSETLIGSCPEVLRHLIELRGIGIIDVMQMFGVQSVKATQSIDLVIKLELWDSSKEYDRLGLREDYIDILGNNIVCHSIPIRPGRNLAIICESAAINHRQKKMGYNAAKTLHERVLKNMSKQD